MSNSTSDDSNIVKNLLANPSIDNIVKLCKDPNPSANYELMKALSKLGDGSQYKDMRWALEHGADPNAEICMGLLPLDYVDDDPELVNLLISYGADTKLTHKYKSRTVSSE